MRGEGGESVSIVVMERTLTALLCCLALAGCGYRAPLHKSYIPVVADTTLYAGIRPEYQQLAALMEKDTDMKPAGGNTVTLVTEGQENLDRLLDDVKKAEISVYIEPYRFCLDSVGTVLAGILREKAAAGADVRIILDKSANTKEDIRELKTLRNNGAQVNTFHRPAFFLDHWIPRLATHRNHRKLLILDGRTAYIGSRNIQDKYFFDWHDTDVRITGPVVADLTEAFHGNQRNIGIHRKKPLYVAPNLEETARRDTMSGLEQFFDVPVQVVPEYPTDRRLPTRNCLEWTLTQAKEYFWYYNPYSPPPQTTIDALQEAARRGVDVRWIAPSITDVEPERGIAESMYEGLLEAGVRIYEWQDHMMHAKQYLCDDYLTILGSSNMDNLSLFLNYELLTILYDERICRLYHEIFLKDLETHCREVTLEEVKKWSSPRKLRNWLLRILGGPLA